MIYNHFIGDTYPSKNSRAGTRPPNTTKRPNLPERFERKAFSIPKQKGNNMECGMAKNLLITRQKKHDSSYFCSVSGIDIRDSYSNNTGNKNISYNDLNKGSLERIIMEARRQLDNAEEAINKAKRELELLKVSKILSVENEPYNNSDYFTQEDAAKFLRVDVRTLRNYHKLYNLTPHGIKKKFYLKADIYAIGARKNNNEPNNEEAS